MTTSISASSAIQAVLPTVASTDSARIRWPAPQRPLAYRPVAPSPSRAGVLGIARTTARPPPSQPSIWSLRRPAAIDTNSGAGSAMAGASRVQTPAITCGLTASSTSSAPARAATASSPATTPKSRASARRASGSGSATRMRSPGWPRPRRPAIRLRAMLPPPMKAMAGAVLDSLGVMGMRAVAVRSGL